MDEKQRAILDEIPRLRRYARSLLRDRDSADDLVQDCLERALLRLDNWQTGESPRKWLFTIMHHLFIDQMRKANRRGGASMLPLEAGEVQAAPAEQVGNVAAREIIDALQAISPDRRAALTMVAIEGFSYAEAAEILGVPAGTLMSRIARGREELRGLLEDAARRSSIRIVETERRQAARIRMQSGRRCHDKAPHDAARLQALSRASARRPGNGFLSACVHGGGDAVDETRACPTRKYAMESSGRLRSNALISAHGTGIF